MHRSNSNSCAARRQTNVDDFNTGQYTNMNTALGIYRIVWLHKSMILNIKDIELFILTKRRSILLSLEMFWFFLQKASLVGIKCKVLVLWQFCL